MPPADGPRDPPDNVFQEGSAVRQSLELQLFDSLVLHLIEKGVLTRNDALSVVQTVAEVERGAQEEQPGAKSDCKLSMLARLYSSYETLPERRPSQPPEDDENIIQLRPPLHRGEPTFPRDD